MPEAYPCNLRGVLVNSNGYQDQDLVDRNDLDSGPPIFRQRADDGWVNFDVRWAYSALEIQVFRNWHRSVLSHGAKSFTIELMIDGFNGTKQTIEHECYFVGPPNYSQKGRRWGVSATLLAIAQVDLNECDVDSLINAFNGFESLNAGITCMDQAIVLLEDLWAP